MPVSEDTEITLGTGKLMAVFFGLVVVCAVFFGMGFSLGRTAAAKAAVTEAQEGGSEATPAAQAQGKSSTPANNAAPELSFYKAVQSKDANSELTRAADDGPSEDSAAKLKPESKVEPKHSAANSAAEIPRRDPPQAAGKSSNYFVQIAAVSKAEDAAALVEALKHKQYAAFSATNPADHFFHVQVGPFADYKDADATRTKLVAAGYSPILKK
ncbi:MAG: SPOR domain-containing protein [Acidobacteriales bacterium]|nr:SPOR domain-containing protein [Terriglobales bacterium]